MRILLTLGANSNTPRRHGSGQNNENITNTRGKRGVLEMAPSVSNVLIILFTSMSSWSLALAPSVSNVLIIFFTSMSSWSARVGPFC
jgi:hypothetical protein